MLQWILESTHIYCDIAQMHMAVGRIVRTAIELRAEVPAVEALMEQTFHTLQTINNRLKSIESHLESFDNWKRSIEQWVKEKDKDTRCKWSVDGNITCYKLVQQNMTWSDSRGKCQSRGDRADHVSIESQEENEFLLKMIRDLRPHNCPHMFTSGRRDSSGVWKWMATGRPFSYTYWMPGQPDNHGGVEDASTMWDHPSGGDIDIESFESEVDYGCLSRIIDMLEKQK
ncbi:hypothetical protein LSAT2_029762 [Lamellibrachia satsuma]|nr:hypothetical protein LSAT2_029762 [Lamellibrachia satsuma]